ncbi:MAG: FtsW/RodA/SpoVE family cell cycle protein [Phocaeicola sp.]|uniref:FtsW/RodA/SpoVE family cell cycle protein n=1 Tax=Phocaeicola TaxID=909656 RepID=UPI00234EA6FE|nr:FtsW/RodA/SpoVE family cell cycle protein [Phocaeicola oris]MCE2617298.1 FtsW/RodA/SpoVE family cell cycle protein [Phocaeicola oris]
MGLVKDLFKGDKVIWIIFLFLCLISIIEVFSAASTLTYKSGDHWAPIRQHATYLMVGFVIVILVHKIPSKWFRAAPFFLLPISCILLLFVMVMGATVNGASRWTSIFGIQFQPSEIAKMAIIIVTAFILSRCQDDYGANKKAFKYIMCCAGIVLLLIAPENASTAALLFGVVFLMMIIGRVPWGQLLKLLGVLGVGLSLFIGMILITPTQKYSQLPMMHRVETWQNRIKGFLDDKGTVPPEKYDIDKDAQVAHANIAIASSNIVGKMPGNSIQRDFLSQAFSDFIFAIIIEELGLLGGAFIVLLYLWLLIRAGRVARKCERSFPAFLIMGIALLLVCQAMMNMMVAVGLFPVTGQPLPLISKGGTSTLINCAYIGMILSISREVNEHQAEEEAALLEEEEKQKKAKDLLNMAIDMANQPNDEKTTNAEIPNKLVADNTLRKNNLIYEPVEDNKNY